MEKQKKIVVTGKTEEVVSEFLEQQTLHRDSKRVQSILISGFESLKKYDIVAVLALETDDGHFYGNTKTEEVCKWPILGIKQNEAFINKYHTWLNFIVYGRKHIPQIKRVTRVTPGSIVEVYEHNGSIVDVNSLNGNEFRRENYNCLTGVYLSYNLN